MARKFLIVDNKFLMSASVELHRDLLDSGRDIKEYKIAGGGLWHMDRMNKKIYLYDKSQEFNAASKEDIVNALNNSHVQNALRGYKFYISRALTISGAITEAEIFDEPDWIYGEKITTDGDNKN